MECSFVDALEKGDLEALRSIPKGDWHNHGTRGAHLRILETWTGLRIPEPPERFPDLAALQDWMNRCILPLFGGKAGFELRMKAAFAQARADGVTVLKTSIGVGTLGLYGGRAEELTGVLQELHREEAPGVRVIPELGLDRGTPPERQMEAAQRMLDTGYFRSLDLNGDESAQPIERFKPIYRAAKARGLLLNAHVGEFGSAVEVREAVEELELDQVQHGIAAARSKPVMRWLADHGIQLNVCPTSNVRLCRVAGYDVHPIGVLHRHGVKVTVNTDDVLVFGQGVSEEFLHLHRAGVLTLQELDAVRRNGLEEPLDG